MMPFTNWRTPIFSKSWEGLGVSKTTLAVWNAIGLSQTLATGLRRKKSQKNSPNHSLKLLLANILRHPAIDLA